MTDAWVFLSIGDAGGCERWVELSEVIGMADSNNHAIPTVSELEASISNLVAAEVAVCDALRFRLTDSGVALYRGAHKPGVGHITRMLDLVKEWNERNFPPASTKTVKIDTDVYKAALQGYRDRFQASYARLLEEQRLSGKANGDLRGYVRAHLRIYRTDEGGRMTKINSGYRPNFDIRHDHDESPLVIAPGGAQVELESGNGILPGGVGHVRLRPLYPESWADISPGQLLYAREGAKVIGEAKVIEIIPPG